MNDLTILRPFASLLDRGYNSLLDEFDNGFFNLDIPQNKVLKARIDDGDNEYTLIAEVPGLTKDQLNITYENGVLSVEANYEEKKEEDCCCCLRAGKFSKAYRISDINSEGIKAELKDGILKVELPKAESAKPRKIKIN
jgi:HSP20 family protein